jgi:anaerobic magnesium-protoporphyrin IX monomethyl ester cyclase
MASRGCPYGCMYCSTSYYWGRIIRYRSGKNVADEVEHLYDKYHVRYVSFADDELTIAKQTVKDFIKEIKERGIDIEFACGSRVDHVDKEYMKYLYDNGCAALYFGVESASQFTLDRIGKRITIERIRKVFRWRKELGRFAMGSFILGFPWETIDDMKRTVDFAIELEPSYAQFTALTPYPGTPFYRYALKYGLIEDTNWEHYTTIRSVIRGFRFTRKELAKMVKYAYRKFFIRWGFIKQEMEAGRLKDILGIILKEGLSYTKDVIVHPLRWITRV